MHSNCVLHVVDMTKWITVNYPTLQLYLLHVPGNFKLILVKSSGTGNFKNPNWEEASQLAIYWYSHAALSSTGMNLNTSS